MRAVLSGILAALAVTPSCDSQSLMASYPYQPAMYTDVSGVSQDLEVFPLNSNAFRVALPFPLGYQGLSPDGKTLYATPHGAGSVRGLFKIEFNPTRVAKVPGTDQLIISTGGFAVYPRGDRILYVSDSCGTLSELRLADGITRKLVRGSPCDLSKPFDPRSAWAHLNVSPDGTRAIAWRYSHLQLIDLVHGTFAGMADGLLAGAWSPDGNWAAVSREGNDKTTETVLLDSKTLQERRTVGPTMLEWSPDSRYLLAGRRPHGGRHVRGRRRPDGQANRGCELAVPS